METNNQIQKLSDDQIEEAFKAAGGMWDGDYWLIEDADLHPFVRAILDARQPAPKSIRKAFVTLESTDGRYSIVMKFNQKADAFDAHDYLLGVGSKEYTAPPVQHVERDAALRERLGKIQTSLVRANGSIREVVYLDDLRAAMSAQKCEKEGQ